MKKISMKVEDLYNNALKLWCENKGKGTIFVPKLIDPKVLVLLTLQKLYMKTPDAKVCLITNSWNDRVDMIEFLTTQENVQNNEEFKRLITNKNLVVITSSILSNMFASAYRLTIAFEPYEINNDYIRVFTNSKFILTVLNKTLDAKVLKELYAYAPSISAFDVKDVQMVRTNTPVEESYKAVTIPDNTEAAKLLAYYDEYIATSNNIYGSFDILQQCYKGNSALNISAMEICAQLAHNNGWSDELDMSVPFNVEIDSLYNPANIRDRAIQTYEIVRKRNELLSSFEGKLDAIKEIVDNNPTKKILIINKKGEFANKVTDYLNRDNTICGNYHDKVSPVPMLDINGSPVLFKSGPNKGKQRVLGATAQKTRTIVDFYNNKIRVISTSNMPDKTLNVGFDIVIITSPLCETIETYLYRLQYVTFTNNKVELYSLYVKNSSEEKRLKSKEISENHKIYADENNVINNENNFDFVIVD